MAVVGLGRISLYKPRGTYQIIFEYIEPKGIGALQVAFEQLKAKLRSLRAMLRTASTSSVRPL